MLNDKQAGAPTTVLIATSRLDVTGRANYTRKFIKSLDNPMWSRSTIFRMILNSGRTADVLSRLGKRGTNTAPSNNTLVFCLLEYNSVFVGTPTSPDIPKKQGAESGSANKR